MRTTPALIKLVIFAVATVLATGVLAATIGNVRFTPTKEYHAIFTDVTGVLPGDDVRIAGVRVGEVRDIELTEQALAKITFTVDDDRPLYTSTRAVIRYRNLLGQRYVALLEGPGDQTPLRDGDTIPIHRTQPALDLTVLFNGFKPLFAALSPEEVNKLAYEIIRTLQGEGGTINSLLAHTASLTATLADRDQVIGDLIEQLNTVLAAVDERDQQLSELIIQMQRLVSGLAEDRKEIGASLVNINALTATTADLLEEGRAPIRNDIRELGELSKTLQDNEALVDEILGRLPTKLETITRTATYGSWFNFYLCDFQGRVVIPNVAQAYTPNFHVNAARCR
ncbi:MCE family protein [Carbonactinospora thermoautotrophica]|uniref:MCE family protein n=1 Tax=Carbonactinospora thermoautotrophica TaxID=1469144 RepID=UPI002271F2C3|nr:MlaD family protein [Carbonactinospora thermoautotrophica]